MTEKLSAQEWRQVLDLSETAANIPANDRLAFLELATSNPQVIQEALLLLGEFLPDLPPVDRVGMQIGRFTINELIGRGATGEVYAARDVKLQRTIAVKFLFPEMAGALLRHRFRRLALPRLSITQTSSPSMK